MSENRQKRELEDVRNGIRTLKDSIPIMQARLESKQKEYKHEYDRYVQAGATDLVLKDKLKEKMRKLDKLPRELQQGKSTLTGLERKEKELINQ